MKHLSFFTLRFSCIPKQASNVMFFAKELGGGQACEKHKSQGRFEQRTNIPFLATFLKGKLESVQSKNEKNVCPDQMAKY